MKLSWDLIEDFLSEELNKTKHIMTFGTIGSLNVKHDIDLIITKNPNSSLKMFFEEIHNIFNTLDRYLIKNHKSFAFRFANSEENFIIRCMVKKQNGVGFHTHIYTNYPQIERDWNWALPTNRPIRNILKNEYKCIKGNAGQIFSKEFMVSTKYDHVLIFLYRYDKINSHYPKKLLIEIMNHYFDYFYRKQLKVNAPIARNEMDVKYYFYQLCDALDKLSK